MTNTTVATNTIGAAAAAAAVATTTTTTTTATTTTKIITTTTETTTITWCGLCCHCCFCCPKSLQPCLKSATNFLIFSYYIIKVAKAFILFGIDVKDLCHTQHIETTTTTAIQKYIILFHTVSTYLYRFTPKERVWERTERMKKKIGQTRITEWVDK